jgi:hypothetical protein
MHPVAASAGGHRSASAISPPRRKRRIWVGAGVTLAVVMFVVAAGASHRAGAPSQSAAVPRRLATAHVLTPETRFLNSEPAPGAVQQIEGLLKAKASRDAGLVNAMVATPSSIWLLGGTPQDAENAARDATTRGARQGRVRSSSPTIFRSTTARATAQVARPTAPPIGRGSTPSPLASATKSPS